VKADDDVGPLRNWEEAPEVAEELHQVSEAALAEAGSIGAKRLLGQVFERELDELMTPEGSSAFSEAHESAKAEEERKREERLLMAAVGKVVAEAVKSAGLRVVRIMLDGETKGGGGYLVRCKDADGRPFEALFGLELAERLAGAGGTTNLVERMGLAASREILAARAKYFARMDVVEVGTAPTAEGAEHAGI
jgi:hypothetical protein